MSHTTVTDNYIFCGMVNVMYYENNIFDVKIIHSSFYMESHKTKYLHNRMISSSVIARAIDDCIGIIRLIGDMKNDTYFKMHSSYYHHTMIHKT